MPFLHPMIMTGEKRRNGDEDEIQDGEK